MLRHDIADILKQLQRKGIQRRIFGIILINALLQVVEILIDITMELVSVYSRNGRRCPESHIPSCVILLPPKISDLQDAQDELDAAIKSLEKRREESTAEKDALDQKIKSQMRPRISELQDHLLEYKLAVEYSKEEQVLSEMEQDMKEELKKYEAEDGLELKFDVDAYYTDEIMERWDKIIDNLFNECRYDKYDISVFSKPLTLVRRLDEEKINVSGNIAGIENGDYSLSSGKKRIGDLWLALMGIDGPTQIIKKNDFTPESGYVRRPAS